MVNDTFDSALFSSDLLLIGVFPVLFTVKYQC